MDIPPPVSLSNVLVQYSDLNISDTTSYQFKKETPKENDTPTDPTSQPEKKTEISENENKSEELVEQETLSQKLYDILASEDKENKQQTIQELLVQGADNSFLDAVRYFTLNKQ